MRPFLLLLLAGFLALPACAQTPKKTKVKAKTSKKAMAKTTPAKEAGPVITFTRTACYGTCPAYTASLYTDGHVDYEGQGHVPVMGKKTLKVPAATVSDLLQAASSAHFGQLQERYSRGTTDIPSTIIAVRQPNGQLKTVTVEEGAPEELQNLITLYRNVLDPLAGLEGKSDH